MSFVQDSINWLKDRVIYMTGRGVLGMGIMLAMGTLTSGSTAMIVAVGVTAAAQATVFWRGERRTERQMVGAYRDEIAATLDIKPADVTIEQMREVAVGNPAKELPGNAVLKDALVRNSKQHLMQMGTSALAGLATLLTAGLLFGFGDAAAQGAGFKDAVRSFMMPEGSVLAGWANSFNSLLGA